MDYVWWVLASQWKIIKFKIVYYLICSNIHTVFRVNKCRFGSYFPFPFVAKNRQFLTLHTFRLFFSPNWFSLFINVRRSLITNLIFKVGKEKFVANAISDLHSFCKKTIKFESFWARNTLESDIDIFSLVIVLLYQL